MWFYHTRYMLPQSREEWWPWRTFGNLFWIIKFKRITPGNKFPLPSSKKKKKKSKPNASCSKISLFIAVWAASYYPCFLMTQHLCEWHLGSLVHCHHIANDSPTTLSTHLHGLFQCIVNTRICTTLKFMNLNILQ